MPLRSLTQAEGWDNYPAVLASICNVGPTTAPSLHLRGQMLASCPRFVGLRFAAARFKLKELLYSFLMSSALALQYSPQAESMKVQGIEV